ALERKNAADPLPRGPAARAQCPVVAMKFAAAIAEHRAARGRRDQLAERRDAVLQRHQGMIPKSMSSTAIGDGYRFSEKIMPKRLSASCAFWHWAPDVRAG